MASDLPMRPVFSARDERVLAGEVELLERPVRPSVPTVTGTTRPGNPKPPVTPRPRPRPSGPTRLRGEAQELAVTLVLGFAACLLVFVAAQAFFALLWWVA